jgi:hypothetical protein
MDADEHAIFAGIRFGEIDFVPASGSSNTQGWKRCSEITFVAGKNPVEP